MYMVTSSDTLLAIFSDSSVMEYSPTWLLSSLVNWVGRRLTIRFINTAAPMTIAVIRSEYPPSFSLRPDDSDGAVWFFFSLSIDDSSLPRQDQRRFSTDCIVKKTKTAATVR